jgi:hypothetical protein
MRDEIEIKINVHGGPLLPSLYFPISQQFKSVLYFLFPAAASVKKKKRRNDAPTNICITTSGRS